MSKTVSSEDYEDVLKDAINEALARKSKYSMRAQYLHESPSTVKEWISTGSLILDLALSNTRNGGVPVGRLVEISGMEGAGKSLLSSYILANTQKMGGVGILIDSERAASLDVMRTVGVNVNKLIYVPGDSVEDSFHAMEGIIEQIKESKSDKLITIVWDSVAGAPTQAEIEGSYSDQTIALKARLISLALRKMIPIISDNRVCCVFINQLRIKIGVTFGDPTTTPGGKAIPFHSSVRLKLNKFQTLKTPDRTVIGNMIKCKIEKNKVAPGQGREVYFTIRWGDKPGAYIDESSTILDTCLAYKIIVPITKMKFKLNIDGLKDVEFKRSTFPELLKDESIYSVIRKQIEDKMIITEENIANVDDVSYETSQED